MGSQHSLGATMWSQAWVNFDALLPAVGQSCNSLPPQLSLYYFYHHAMKGSMALLFNRLRLESNRAGAEAWGEYNKRPSTCPISPFPAERNKPVRPLLRVNPIKYSWVVIKLPVPLIFVLLEGFGAGCALVLPKPTSSTKLLLSLRLLFIRAGLVLNSLLLTRL